MASSDSASSSITKNVKTRRIMVVRPYASIKANKVYQKYPVSRKQIAKKRTFIRDLFAFLQA